MDNESVTTTSLSTPGVGRTNTTDSDVHQSGYSDQSASKGADQSHSGHVDDRLAQLEDFMNEIRHLLPANLPKPPTYSPNKEPRLMGSSASAQKRRIDEAVVLDEGSGRNVQKPAFGRESDLQQGQLTVRESQWPLKDEHPVPMRLRNCLKGACFLPPADMGSALLNEYLADFNSKIPLYRPQTIYTNVRDCYSGSADGNPLLFVLTYTTFGIAHRLRAAGLFAALDDTANADWYLNKCLGVLPDLLMEKPSLELVQALLGVAILLQSSAKSRRSSLFLSTAMHMAQDLGYNEACPNLSDELGRDKQEVYVFWITFVLDTAMSLHSNRPNTQKLEDINVPLPSANSSDWWASDESVDDSTDWKLNVFALRASLALIQAEASEELFSVKARRRSPAVQEKMFQTIVSKLENWRRNCPLAEIGSPSMLSMYHVDLVHLNILEASYFETLYQIHAAHALEAFNRRIDVFNSENLKLATGKIDSAIFGDAQRLLTLASIVPQGNVSVTW